MNAILRSLSLALVSLAALSAGALAQDEPQVVEPGPKAPGGKTLHWNTPENKPYWYRVPKKLDKKHPPNLLLMLHGTGMTFGWAFWNYPIASGGFRPDDIVVAPEGMTPGSGDTFNFLQGKADGDHIADLIRFFKERYEIGNVYLYGHSQGAFFCYWFAGEYPELVDGIVAHAGNVLQVKHSDLARKKVAIGILHGESDQVVSVECAYRTERIYREEGYEKLKLYVVEGLREEAGHWPLPVQVGEMLEWLDQVSSHTPGQAVRVAVSELTKEAGDLFVVAESAVKARKLLKKYKGDDKDELAARVDELEAFLEEAQAAHAKALLAEPTLAERDLVLGPWAVHFRRAHRVFADNKSWKGSLKRLVKEAAKHEKQVDKAIGSWEKPSKKAFSQSLEALEEAWLSSRWNELAALMETKLERPPKGVKPDQVAEVRAAIEAGSEPIAKGIEAAAAIDGELAAGFREAHAELFVGEG